MRIIVDFPKNVHIIINIKTTKKEVKMRFDTSKYENSHARQPRGRGQWGFFDENGDLYFTPAMTFTDAKRWARANLKGNATVVVAP